jgi:hypothetical protein
LVLLEEVDRLVIDGTVHDRFLCEEAAIHEKVEEGEASHAQELPSTDLVKLLHLDATLLANIL